MIFSKKKKTFTNSQLKSTNLLIWASPRMMESQTRLVVCYSPFESPPNQQSANQPVMNWWFTSLKWQSHLRHTYYTMLNVFFKVTKTLKRFFSSHAQQNKIQSKTLKQTESILIPKALPRLVVHHCPDISWFPAPGHHFYTVWPARLVVNSELYCKHLPLKRRPETSPLPHTYKF